MTTQITPQQYGVGARFTLSVYDSDYVRIIMDALSAANPTDLEIDTGDISTFISGPEQRIMEYLRDVILAAAQTGAHISASILLSRGCPGELQCELPLGVSALGANPVLLDQTERRARAHWSLYPLLDAIKDCATPAEPKRHGGDAVLETGDSVLEGDDAASQDRSGSAGVLGDHMAPIYAVIEEAKEAGIYSGSDHFATRLDGDLADVLETVANAWISVGANVQHVVTHATISMNSPTPV